MDNVSLFYKALERWQVFVQSIKAIRVIRVKDDLIITNLSEFYGPSIFIGLDKVELCRDGEYVVSNQRWSYTYVVGEPIRYPIKE